jgi:hypothetical protein
MVSEMDDRGQLLLAGALLIGVVIVGSIVLLNGVQFADATGSEGSQGAVRNAERLSHMIEQDVEELVRQVRASEPNNLSRALQANLSTYNRYYSAMQISDGAVFVNLSLDVSASRGGLINESGVRYNDGRSNNWDPVTNADALSVFDLNFTKIQGNDFEVVVSDANTSDQWRMNIQPGGIGLIVTVSNESGVLDTFSMDAAPDAGNDESIDFDLIAGEASDSTGDSGRFAGILQHVGGNYTIEFEDTNNKEGSYRIGVTDGINYGNYDGCSGPSDTGDSGCAVEGYLVTPAIDISYNTPELTYETTRFIDPEVGT